MQIRRHVGAMIDATLVSGGLRSRSGRADVGGLFMLVPIELEEV